MMKKLKNGLMMFIVFCFIITATVALSSILTLTLPTSAQAATVDPWGGQQANISKTIGLGNRDPRLIAASVINVILGFLGIIAVVIVLLGGFKWMTAGGNDDKIGEAKGLLSAGVIGLIIVLASWGLAQFVVNLLFNATQ